MMKPIIKISDPEKEFDKTVQILMDPDILKYYPLDGEKEAIDAIKICMGYVKFNACYSAYVEDEFVGIANLYLTTSEKIKHQSLFMILIAKHMRGKGLGTSLLKHLIHEAKHRHNIKLLHLDVYEGNPAKRLYERLGFKEYGRHKGFLKEANGQYRTKIMMQKWLGE